MREFSQYSHKSVSKIQFKLLTHIFLHYLFLNVLFYESMKYKIHTVRQFKNG